MKKPTACDVAVDIAKKAVRELLRPLCDSDYLAALDDIITDLEFMRTAKEEEGE